MRENIVIVTIKEWNIENYFKLKELYSDQYNFYLITQKEELNYEYISHLNPSFLFFPHWSWIIPREVYANYESIVFHMTDLPYGRGGSPLQNLIIEKVYDTKISAIKVEEGLDTGDIYIKESFDIRMGSAEEIFIKLSEIIFFKMIPNILTNRPHPMKQEGQPVVFKRRKPQESNMYDHKYATMVELYDFIRMLDAEGYPKAYLELDDFKIQFSEVHIKNGKLIGRFEVFKDE